VPNETAAELIVTAAHAIAPDLPIIVRAATADRLDNLFHLGARHAVNPEMEGGLEMLRLTLLALGYSAGQIQQYIDTVRTDTYEGILPGQRGYPALDQLLMATRGVEIAWQPLDGDSPLVGQTLAEANIRSRTGASVVAVLRGGEVITNPGPELRFMAGDLVGLIGERAEVGVAGEMLRGTS